MVSLSLMAFVLLLLLSVSTLTQIEVQSAAAQHENLKAKQNAILGLKTAIGQLQKLTGPDTRITAPAALFDVDPNTDNIDGVNNNNWIGVWDSDPGIDHLNDRLDTTNSYYNYGARRDGSDGRFLGWLVSGQQDEITDCVTTIAANDEILIFGAEFDPSDPSQIANQVRVLKVPVSDTDSTTGNYAYWVSDENLKARIDAYEPALTTGSITAADVKRSRFIVNQRSAIEKVKSVDNIFAQINTTIDLNKLSSTDDLNFLLSDPEKSQSSLQQNAHALSSSSISLLTDSYASGLKTDLSTLLRQPSLSTALNEGIPAYVNSDGSHAIARYPSTTSDHPAPPSATWELLQSYVTNTADASSNIIAVSKHSSTNHGYYPVITRFWLNIVPVLESAGTVDRLNYYIEPILVLNNPYSSKLQLDEDMYAHIYFEKRDLAQGKGIRIGNTFKKQDPSGGWHERWFGIDFDDSSGSGWDGADLFENEDLIDYTDSNMVNYRGFSFKMPKITLDPGEITALGIADDEDGSAYTGTNRLQKGASSLTPSYVIMLHKGADGVAFESDPSWTSMSSIKNQVLLKINIDSGAIQQHADSFINPKTGNSIHRKLLPFKVAVGLSDEATPATQEDFYHLAVGIECSNPNAQMWASGQNQKIARNHGRDVDSFHSYPDMKDRAINFDIVMASGFKYDGNEINGEQNDCASGYRLNNRWLTGQSFRAPYHVPMATDDQNKSPNTLYGGIAGFQPWINSGQKHQHNTEVQVSGTNAYWGTGIDINDGEQNVTFFDVPHASTGILSLAQLQHMQISSVSSSHLYGIGTGIADLKIGDSGALYKETDFEAPATQAYLPVDQNFLINNALWDGFYFSGLTSDVTSTDLKNWKTVPLNNRYQFTAAATPEKANDPKNTSQTVYIRGGFNINSTQKEAWKALLAGANTLEIDTSGIDSSRSLQSPISRSSFPSQPSGTSNSERLNGFRELSDSELENLAAAITAEIKKRGPFLSLGDFVNRRIEAGNTNTGLYGTLEAAIRSSGINDIIKGGSNQPLGDFSTDDLPKWSDKPSDYIEQIFEGSRAAGISQWITQADLLQRIAPSISARSDTFVIRTYGESIDPLSGKTTATAIGEATVRRTYNYVDSSLNSPDQAAVIFDNASTSNNYKENYSLSEKNKQLGRQYTIVSFRWL